MEIVFIILLMIGLAAALFWDRRSQDQHVARTGEAWAAAHEITLGPVGTICHGDRPPGLQPRIFGALALTADRLLFAGQRVTDYDLDAPPDWVRWVGVRTNIEPKGRRMFRRRGLVVHLETPDGWRVYTFTDLRDPQAFAAGLAALTGLEMHDIDTAYEDFGPAPARYLRQDAGGDWTPALPDPIDPMFPPADWDGLRHTLYLAPDRLLFDWQHSIPLATIRRLDVYPAGHAANPFDLDLLRVEIARAGAGPEVVAFEVADAGDWADEIGGHIDAPVHTHRDPA